MRGRARDFDLLDFMTARRQRSGNRRNRLYAVELGFFLGIGKPKMWVKAIFMTLFLRCEKLYRTKRIWYTGHMPRPRKFDPTTLIRPLLHDFAAEIAGAVERMTIDSRSLGARLGWRTRRRQIFRSHAFDARKNPLLLPRLQERRGPAFRHVLRRAPQESFGHRKGQIPRSAWRSQANGGAAKTKSRRGARR